MLAFGLPTTATATKADVIALYRSGAIELEAGDVAAARSVQQTGLRLAEELRDTRAVAYGLFALQRTMRRLERHQEAHDLQVRSLQLFREVGDRVGIALALNSIGQQSMVRGDFTAARACLEEALETAEMMHVYYNLGQVALEDGELSEARRQFATYLGRTQGIDYKDGIVQGLEGFARLAAAGGQAARAIRLAAAADALRQILGTVLSPYWRQEMDRRLQPAQRLLGDAMYESIWNEGRLMGMNDAVTYALEP